MSHASERFSEPASMQKHTCGRRDSACDPSGFSHYVLDFRLVGRQHRIRQVFVVGKTRQAGEMWRAIIAENQTIGSILTVW